MFSRTMTTKSIDSYYDSLVRLERELDTADAVDAGDTIAKAQEIAVLPAGADEPVRTITEQDELDDFVHALALETWRPEAVPADAAAVGQFELS